MIACGAQDLEDGGADVYLGANGLVERSKRSSVAEFGVPPPRIVTPDWAKHAVWYQIFAINPGVSLDLHGCLAVPYGPAISLLHVELAPAGLAMPLRWHTATPVRR